MFYVYTLSDPLTKSVFYVGKGKGGRIQAHEREAEKGVHSAKCERIREIWAAGLQVQRAVVSRHDDENDALQAEFDLIAEIGLAHLTNVTPGGVMGAQVYLARLADAERRKKARDAARVRGQFDDLAPRLAYALRCNAHNGGFGAYTNGRWIEFGPALESLVRTALIPLLGAEYVAEKLKPHGVEIVGAWE